MSLKRASSLLKLVIAVAVLALEASAQTPEQVPVASPQEQATMLAKLDQAWGPPLSSPGASIQLKEMSREGNKVRYRLYAKGLPHDLTYSLLSFPISQTNPSRNLTGVTLDETGLAICAGKPGSCGAGDHPNDPIDLVTEFNPGEPFRVGLLSEDGKKTGAYGKIIPFPNQATDKGCKIETIMLMPASEAVEILGQGFAPDTDIKFESSSEGKSDTGTSKSDATGRYLTVLTPYISGKSKGVTHVQVISKGCSPALDFKWGKKD